MAMARLLSFSIAIFCLFVSLSAQIPFSGTPGENSRLGGLNVIAGTVHWPDGSKVDRRISVKIRPQTSGDIMLTTDESGQFVLINLRAGTYNVIIDREEGFEPVNQIVDIVSDGDRLKPVYTVSIRLVAKKNTEPKATVVSAETAGIPKRAKDLYVRALELARAGDSTESIRQLKLAVAEYSNFIEALNEMAVQYQKLGELEKADEALVEALKIRPDAFEPMMNRGIVLFRLERYDAAEELLRKIVSSAEPRPLAHFYLGRTLAKLGRAADAEQELLKSLEKGNEAEMKEAHRMLASIYIERDDRPKAAASLERYIALAPNAPDIDRLKAALADIKRAIGKP